MTFADLMQALPLVLFVLVVAALRWNLKRVPDWGEVQDAVVLPREPDGAAVVPVTQLIHRRTLGSTTNGISPRLAVTGTGLRFKVFKANERAFTDFTRVEAHKSLFHGTRLSFIGRGEQLQVMIRERGAARALLRLLPPELPLSPAAEALRSGGGASPAQKLPT